MKKVVFSIGFFLLTLALTCTSGHYAVAQNNQTLFTIDGAPVSVSEFEYVYNKNNISGEADYSEPSLREYLGLYVNFRLKVKEAEALGMDTIKALSDELATYRSQLAKSYLTDKQLLETLMKEAFNRNKLEIKASHIMLKLSPDALPDDTLRVYNKLMDLRKRILSGQEDFEMMARMNSEDPSVKDNGGNLGYLTVFQTVYPFENAMYNTPVGSISKPVRTRFGYHLLKITDKRATKGDIRVAHILIQDPKDKSMEALAQNEQKARAIYDDIINGNATFEEQVMKFSDDKKTKSVGGELPWFGSGSMLEEFENAAFALKNDGDVSKPIHTIRGWHILKRLELKEPGTYESMKTDLKRKVERDSRSKLAKSQLITNIKNQYGFKEFPSVKADMFSKIDKSVLLGQWAPEDVSMFQGTLFRLGEKEYTQLDFSNYLEFNLNRGSSSSKEKLLQDHYNIFVQNKCLEYEEGKLEDKNPDFRALMKEYHDGILLFELTDDKVWSKAIKDTTGLRKFHEANKNNYLWNERAAVTIFNCKNIEIANKARKLALKKSASDVATKLNKNSENNPMVSFTTGKFERGQNEWVDKYEWKKGITENFTDEYDNIAFIKYDEIIPAQPKQLREAKGYVVSDYQEFLEKDWIRELKNKYTVVINEQVFKSLIQ